MQTQKHTQWQDFLDRSIEYDTVLHLRKFIYSAFIYVHFIAVHPWALHDQDHGHQITFRPYILRTLNIFFLSSEYAYIVVGWYILYYI